jgi:outer membrane lipoprotein-sorting protein
MKRVVFVSLALAMLLLIREAAAITADEIVKKANHAAYYNGDNGKAKVSMAITDSLGRTREREMTILRLDAGDDAEQKFYVYFHKPNDVAGMSYLVWKHVAGDDDRWLYLPALDLVRRVAASDERSSFAGTNFVYEDISGRGVEEDAHTLLSEDENVYRIKNVPKDGEAVEFSYFETEIDKNNFMPLKAEYYDKNGKLYRVIEALEIKDVQGFTTIIRMKASDLNAGSSTVSDFSEIGYNIGVTDDIFTERSLRRPPRQIVGR